MPRICLLVCLALFGQLHASETITIFAAASTGDVLSGLAAEYEKTHGVMVVTSLAATSTLAKQIEQGAPADLFLSADQKWMDYLAERKLIKRNSRCDLLGNELVIVAPKDKPLAVTIDKNFDFAQAFSGRLAVADPTAVPAGIYARESLVALGWWDALQARLAPAVDVRAALKLVELGEADAGVVYATDAMASDKVVVAAVIPATLHMPILYPIALTVTAKPRAADFLDYLKSPPAIKKFRVAGFFTPTSEKAPAGAAH